MTMMTRWNRTGWTTPYDALTDVRRELDRVFGESERTNGGSVLPLAMDVIETADELRATIELPGVRPEDVEITVDDNVLTVAGEKKVTLETDDEAGVRISERRYGRFERSFVLPQNVDSERVSADVEHGVLMLRLPKREEAKPRRIRVGVNGGEQVG